MAMDENINRGAIPWVGLDMQIKLGGEIVQYKFFHYTHLSLTELRGQGTTSMNP